MWHFDGNDSSSNGGDYEYLIGCLDYDYGDDMVVLKYGPSLILGSGLT